MLHRRKFLGGVAVAVAAAAVGVGAERLQRAAGAAAARKRSGLDARAATQGASSPLGALDAAPGTQFGRCAVQKVAVAEDGAIAVHMRDSKGEPFELELLAHDDRTPGVARAGSLGVYMRNNGRGDKATIEEHGLAAMAFAAHVRRLHAAGASLPSAPTLTRRSGRTLSSRA